MDGLESLTDKTNLVLIPYQTHRRTHSGQMPCGNDDLDAFLAA